MAAAIRAYGLGFFGFALALSAGGLAWLAGKPVPFLLGAVVLSLVLGGFKVRPAFPDPFRVLAFILLGYMIGSTASNDFFASAALWVPSVMVAIALIPAITFASALVIARITDLTPDEALLSSVPGSLPFVVAASDDLGLRTPYVMLFQSVRLLTLTFLLPFALRFWFELPVVPVAPASEAASLVFWVEALTLLGGLVLACLFAWMATKLRVPGGAFIGPMMGIAILKLAGLPLPDLPLWLLFGAQAGLGWIMGARFDMIPVSDLRKLALAALAGLATGLAVVLLACGALVALTDLSFKALLLGLAPGAIETVTSIAFEEGVDPLFVSTHQISRMLCIPIIAAGMLVVGRRMFALMTRRREDR